MGNTLESINPINDPAINPNYPATPEWSANNLRFAQVVTAWCGAAYNSATDEMWLGLGGGHSDYAGNEVLACNFYAAAPVCRMVRKPSGAIGNLLTTNDGQEASGVYSDGRPRATHGYNKWVHIPGVGPALAVLGSTSWTAGGGKMWPVIISEANGEAVYGPEAASNLPSAGSGLGAGYDSIRNVIWAKDKGTSALLKYTPSGSNWAAGAWAAVGASFVTPGGASVTHIPELDLILVGCGDADGAGAPNWFVFDPVTSTVHTPAFTGALAGGAVQGAGQPRWVPALGAVCLWNNSSATTLISKITPGANPRVDAWAISTLPVTGGVTPSVRAAMGTFGRFAYSSRLGGFVVVNNTAGPYYFYKI